MALVGVGIVTFLMAFIVPKIVTLFVKQGRELPALTNALIAVTDFLARMVVAGRHHPS